MAAKKGKQFMVGAVVGSVLGAVTALLLAPKSGRELRADIKEGAQAVSTKTQQVAGEVSAKTKQTVTVLTEKTGNAARTIGKQTSVWADRAKVLAIRTRDEVKGWRVGAVRREEQEAGDIAPVAATTIEADESEK